MNKFSDSVRPLIGSSKSSDLFLTNQSALFQHSLFMHRLLANFSTFCKHKNKTNQQVPLHEDF